MEEFKMYGFYDNRGRLIDAVPDISIEGAKEWFNNYYPDTEYFYIEVIK